MTPDLLISLSALPGLDATGLAAEFHYGEWWVGIVLDPADQHSVRAYLTARGQRGLRSFGRQFVRLDLADSSTRDRVARWCIAKLELTAHNGVRWGACVKVGGCSMWSLHGDGPYTTFGPKGWHKLSVGELDSDDDTRLPDGSRAVDAAALKLVAEHLGRQS